MLQWNMLSYPQTVNFKATFVLSVPALRIRKTLASGKLRLLWHNNNTPVAEPNRNVFKLKFAIDDASVNVYKLKVLTAGDFRLNWANRPLWGRSALQNEFPIFISKREYCQTVSSSSESSSGIKSLL